MTADIAKLKALAERLRFPLGLGSYDPTYDLRHEAADRIEELEKERDEALRAKHNLYAALESKEASVQDISEFAFFANHRRCNAEAMWGNVAIENSDLSAALSTAEKRVAELEAALRPFAKASENINPDFLDSAEIECRSAYVSGKYPGRFIIAVANFSRARKALGDQP